MNKTITKKHFIEKLRFHLAFYFNDEESTSILNDYEEWFENEALQGKSEQEICAALNSPKKTVSNLRSESCRNPVRIHILFQNTLIQVFLLILVNVLLSILALKTCDGNSFSYLYFASGIIFADFIAGMFIIKKNPSPEVHSDRKNFLKGNLSVFVFSVIILLSEMLLLPKLSNSNSGERCVFVLSALILILVLINLYVVVKKILEARQLVFFTTLHISGTATFLFYTINQLHMLHPDKSEALSSIISGSIGIYIETVILCIIFLLIKKDKGNR